MSDNPYGLELYPVTSPTGSVLNLLTPEEASYYEDRCSRYTTDNAFPNVSDLQELDRLLMMEVFVYRWTLWMGQSFDYLHAIVDEADLSKKVKEYSTEIRLIKQALGIDKSTRDKEKGESLADYTEKLLERAKIFGYHRNQQYELAVTKFYELRSMVMTYYRCDEEERAELDLSPERILEWIRDFAVNEWDELSESFRNDQKMWVRDQ
jgi:hypothetical protein